MSGFATLPPHHTDKNGVDLSETVACLGIDQVGAVSLETLSAAADPPDSASGRPDHQTVGGNIGGDDSSGSHHRPLSDLHGSDTHSPRADRCPPAHGDTNHLPVLG